MRRRASTVADPSECASSGCDALKVTRVEPELWVGDPAAAIDFYARAFNATVIHRVGFDNEIVAQLGIDNARIWVSNSGSRRLDPRVIGGSTGRTLLVTTEPDAVVAAPSRPAQS